MEIQAKFKHLRITARKARAVVDQVRGKSVSQALDILRFERKVIAKDVEKLILSAVANAKQKGGIRVDQLFIKKIVVDGAGMLKRMMPRARGASAAIQKKMSHISVVLEDKI